MSRKQIVSVIVAAVLALGLGLLYNSVTFADRERLAQVEVSNLPVDEEGNLKSTDEIQMGVAEWFKAWQPDLDHNKALARAAHYMKAMPAWAE